MQFANPQSIEARGKTARERVGVTIERRLFPLTIHDLALIVFADNRAPDSGVVLFTELNAN
jgi:hypothetical protein